MALDPYQGHFLLHKAHCLFSLYRREEAFNVAQAARVLFSNDASGLDLIGTFYSIAGRKVILHGGKALLGAQT